MARESQSLQIAFIVCVIVAIAFAVATFFVARTSSDRLARAEGAEKEASQANSALRDTQGEFNELKRFAGFEDTATIQNIRDAFNNDMVAYAGSTPETNRSYRKVLETVAKALETKSANLAAEQATVQELKTRNESLEAAKQAQIAAAEGRAKKAEDDLAAERQKFTTDRQSLQSQLAAIQGQLDGARKDAASQVAKVEEDKKKITGELGNARLLLAGKNQQLEQILTEKFEVADGRIRWVNQRQKTAYIDLGSADGLARLTSFAVYSSAANDVSDAQKKGSIEVTRLLGDHLAEARIVEDETSNPIMPGDVVNTAIWSPGEREHVALGAGIDVNSDGKNDLDMVRKLVTTSGGVVDAYLDDQGNIQGKITPQTRFVVMGKEPSVNAPPDVFKNLKKMLDDADLNGVKRITLPELLSRIGWKNDTRVVTFGRGANPADFQIPPADGMERVSNGQVSESFRERYPAQPRMTTY